MPQPPRYDPNNKQSRRKPTVDALRAKLSYNASHRGGKAIGDYNVTHSHGEPVNQRNSGPGRSPAAHGQPKQVPFSQLAPGRSNKAPQVPPALIQKLQEKLGTSASPNPAAPTAAATPRTQVPLSPARTGQMIALPGQRPRRRKPRRSDSNVVSQYPR